MSDTIAGIDEYLYVRPGAQQTLPEPSSKTPTLAPGFLCLRGDESEGTPLLTMGDGSQARCKVIAEQLDAATLRIRSNALPNYVPFVGGRRADGTGSWSAEAGLGDRNPNPLCASEREVLITVADLAGTEPAPTADGLAAAPMGPIGVAINGVPLYNPFAAAFHAGQDNFDAMRLEAFDTGSLRSVNMFLHLLASLGLASTWVEVGVRRGDFSSELLSRFWEGTGHLPHLYLVDTWKHQGHYQLPQPTPL